MEHTTSRDVYVRRMKEQIEHQAAMLMEKDLEMLKLVAGKDFEENELEQPTPKTKGKGPPGWDWLSPMKSGTEFLCKMKGQRTWLIFEYTHGGKKEGNVLLLPTMSLQDTRTWFWVDPVEFCRQFELRCILEEPDAG